MDQSVTLTQPLLSKLPEPGKYTSHYVCWRILWSKAITQPVGVNVLVSCTVTIVHAYMRARPADADNRKDQMLMNLERTYFRERKALCDWHQLAFSTYCNGRGRSAKLGCAKHTRVSHAVTKGPSIRESTP